MGITYFEESRIFKLDTPHSTYMIGIVDEENFVGHIYYGRKVSDSNLDYLLRIHDGRYVPSENNRDRMNFLDTFPMEYPVYGQGDFKEACIRIDTDGHRSTMSLSYETCNIYKGKPALDGLPATFGSEEECTTLELICRDNALKAETVLYYTVFDKLDVITRSVKIYNHSDENLYLEKVLSSCLDMDNRNYDMLTLDGQWSKERMINRRKITEGKHRNSSSRGTSSHQSNPFLAVLAADANDDYGDVYGMNLVYSGDFMAQTELTSNNIVRAVIGINPENFRWKLEKDDSFTSPEAVLVYSSEGIGGMTRTYHDLYRNHLIRGYYKDKKRPVLINNWEVTYFDFNMDKLVAIAREAAKVGIEMFVLDDGWFGKRNDDNTSLGDWYANEDKLEGGLPYLVEQVNEAGLKFGIWFEPEMVSPDSDLYRAHPDWAICNPERTGTLARNQYVLDISRKEVRDAVYLQMKKVLQSANIEYVKWDMNRSLTNLGSCGLPADRQGELSHRYVLGLYEMQEQLITDFPGLLLENCASGGGRYDPGMLYYSPQIWCSDDTDAIERLKIQEGTAMLYPLSTMASHVAACPSHSTGRSTPFETRGYVALAGTFGYELDIAGISEEERNMIPSQIAMYHKYNELIRTGDYYRIASYQLNHECDCYEVVSKDKSEALVTFIRVSAGLHGSRSQRIFLKGLNPEEMYLVEETGQILSGGALMYAGIQVANLWGAYKGRMYHIVRDGQR